MKEMPTYKGMKLLCPNCNNSGFDVYVDESEKQIATFQYQWTKCTSCDYEYQLLHLLLYSRGFDRGFRSCCDNNKDNTNEAIERPDIPSSNFSKP